MDDNRREERIGWIREKTGREEGWKG